MLANLSSGDSHPTKLVGDVDAAVQQHNGFKSAQYNVALLCGKMKTDNKLLMLVGCRLSCCSTKRLSVKLWAGLLCRPPERLLVRTSFLHVKQSFTNALHLVYPIGRTFPREKGQGGG